MTVMTSFIGHKYTTAITLIDAFLYYAGNVPAHARFLPLSRAVNHIALNKYHI